MSEALNKVKQLEQIREYTSQDGSFDFVEYHVLDQLRKDILKRTKEDPTLPVMLQERTFVTDGVSNYRIYVFVNTPEKKKCVYVGSESPDIRAINRELWNWVLGTAS